MPILGSWSSSNLFDSVYGYSNLPHTDMTLSYADDKVILVLALRISNISSNTNNHRSGDNMTISSAYSLRMSNSCSHTNDHRSGDNNPHCGRPQSAKTFVSASLVLTVLDCIIGSIQL